MADQMAHRTVSVETLREWYREQSELSSLRKVADLVGVNKGVVSALMEGSAPHPRTRRLLALHYLEAIGEEPYRDALAVLVDDDAGMQRRAAGALVGVYVEAGKPVPGWLERFANEATAE